MTFARDLAQQRGDEIAVRDPDRSLTWQEADDALRPLVNGLLAHHFRAPRRIAVYAANSVQALLYYAAAALAGTAAVAVNFHLTPAEAAFIFEDSEVDVVLVDDVTAERGAEAAAVAGVSLVVGGTRPVRGVIPLQDWMDTAGSAEPPTDHEPRRTVVYTSGTTGKPKAVQLPPTSWVGGADIPEHLARLAKNSLVAHGRHLVVGPMYHSGPLTGTRLFLGGAPVTILGRFDAEGLLQAVERDRVGSTIVVPTHLQRLLALSKEVRDRYDISSLVFVLQVGAKCPEPVKRQIIDWFGPILWESYGASEVGTTCMISSTEWLEHPGSVGRAIAPFEAVILDDDNRPVTPGVQGRLYFRDTTGYGLKYLNADAADVTLGADLFTLGEIGLMDADGYVWITDRASDMVVSGGVNIYPAESEKVLAQHPAIRDVCCFGVPDEEMGEKLVAAIVPADDAPTLDPADLIAWCRERLTHYKCPKRAYLVPEVTRTALGKIDKRSMKTRLINEQASHTGG